MSEKCNHCHGSCDSCQEVELNGCPNCGRKGLEVGFETVLSLTKPGLKDQVEKLKESKFFLCTQRPCHVAYYSDEAKMMLNQISVPIWFKHQKEEYFVCYCRRITLNEVLEAVKLLEEPTKESIVKLLNRQDVITDCIHNNPTGSCCDRLFDNAILYALKQKGVNQ